MKEVMAFLEQLTRGKERKETYNKWVNRVATWDNYVKERNPKKNDINKSISF
ncbi:MAG: hypothetical protein ACFE8N_11970 [Promethearchaeota archaeon]